MAPQLLFSKTEIRQPILTKDMRRINGIWLADTGLISGINLGCGR
jgi:hypothetical protein